MGVPGRVRQWQLKLLRQPFRDQQSLVAERGEGTGGAAELQHHGFTAQPLQSHARAVQGGGIFGELETERHRQRMLQPGACHDWGVAMLPREGGKARNGAAGIRQQRIDARAQSQHGGGIDHVLAGGAPMHIARSLTICLGDVSGQRLDEGDREIAGTRRGLCQSDKVERAGVAGSRDRASGARWNHARRRLGAREGCFKIEHVLQTRQIVADDAHGGARQHGGKQGRERGTHGAGDLTIPAGLCQSPKNLPQGVAPEHPHMPVALRICIAPRPPIPFLLTLPCFTWDARP
jgi:hypothetical protein